MSDASPTCAPHNPMNTGAGCRNLTVNNSQNAKWLRNNGNRTSWDTRSFYPAVYFQYNSGSVNSASSYTQVEIKSGSTYVGGANRSDCAAAPPVLMMKKYRILPIGIPITVHVSY